MHEPEALRPPASDDNAAQYDAVVISTSPVALMAALALQTSGRRVLLVDDRPQVGGAWITANIGGFSNVEVGCHLLDPDRGVYDFLRGLGIPMQPLSPQPVVFSRGPRLFPRKVPYSHRWLRDLYNLVPKRNPAGLLEFGKSHSLKDIARRGYRVSKQMLAAFRGRTRPILYPPGGCNEIMARLIELLALSGVEVRTATTATNVSLDREAGIVRLRLNGQQVTARSVYITASVRLGPIQDGDREIELAANPLLFQNLYLVLKDAGPVNLTYTLLYEDPLVHRVSDLTRFARPEPGFEDAKILGLTVDEHRAESPEFARECFERLKEYRWVAKDATLLDSCFLPYRFSWLDLGQRKWLKQELAPLMRILDSENMTHSIKTLLASEDVSHLLAFAAAHPAGEASATALDEALAVRAS